MKSLKITKGQSESIYRRRTDNTMAKEKVQKDKQRSTKHTHKTKDQVTRTPLQTGGELRFSYIFLFRFLYGSRSPVRE
jgi:hypothetical protein